MLPSKRNLKARYMTKGPRVELVTYMKCWMDEETKSLQMEEVTEEKKCWMVFFPNGHSIRVTDFDELKRMGYHLKPRIIDMETGDVVDVGGDPYDFGVDDDDTPIALEDDNEVPKSRRRSTEAANV